jgi:aryl-alcohol dehydrogenase-like predicted oxidoreductase
LSDVQFGLGLVSLGRQWGVRPSAVPPRDEALQLLQVAVELGVRIFDTAPSYGMSEMYLGDFLGQTSSDRNEMIIATKCGEQWDAETGSPSVDHSFEVLQRSVDRSLERLGRVDLLQLHKASAQVLHSPDVSRAFEYAKSCGIAALGASVSDMEAFTIAAGDPRLDIVQLFYNQNYRQLEEAFPISRAAGKRLFINRPFAMGALITDHSDCEQAYRFILRQQFTGVVLTGTRSIQHLKANLDAFRHARAARFPLN